ncbi:hypothetical protein RlegWSM1455_22930 [Rhizobium laguerreae]|uniref:hypothetical protein n=1 Tax=Rhizobium laguerreae TaxID=1076926 RepID=UPI001E59F170|nr:hypothetical protein [Rhizobium laguerreae]UFW64312.1 hypothetical protein RlegWSM1455_22930 [Rhizobium laguerreae]
MDPITGAILAIAPALAQGLLTDIVKDSYLGLKEIIKRKFGEASPIEQAVEGVEARPESKARAAVLEEEVASASATEDADIMKALAHLVENLRKEGSNPLNSGIHISISGGNVSGIVGAQEARIEELIVGEGRKLAGPE